jgi:hypothetical protein
MRAGFASLVLAASLTSAASAGMAADTITVTFDDLPLAGVGHLVGVDTDPNTPESGNVGYEGLYWAWTGSGVVDPGHPANDGFYLGNRSEPGFEYVGGSSPLFAYTQQRTGTAYITSVDQPFAFLGGIFSSTSVGGTLSIVGQVKKNDSNGIGGGTFEDAPGALATIAFDAVTTVVPFSTQAFGNVDRLVITSSSAGGNPFQWALDDFNYAPVPEPSTWAMLGLGFAAVGFSVQRRRRKTQ